jgi:hypothetical protein
MLNLVEDMVRVDIMMVVEFTLVVVAVEVVL